MQWAFSVKGRTKDTSPVDRKIFHGHWYEIQEILRGFEKHFPVYSFCNLIHLYSSSYYIHEKELIPKIQNTKTPTPPGCCHKTSACRAEVKIQIPLPHGTCALSLRGDSHSRDVLKPVRFRTAAYRLLQAASRSRNDHCVFAANQGFTVSHVSSTKLWLIHYIGCSEEPRYSKQEWLRVLYHQCSNANSQHEGRNWLTQNNTSLPLVKVYLFTQNWQNLSYVNTCWRSQFPSYLLICWTHLQKSDFFRSGKNYTLVKTADPNQPTCNSKKKTAVWHVTAMLRP